MLSGYIVNVSTPDKDSDVLCIKTMQQPHRYRSNELYFDMSNSTLLVFQIKNLSQKLL